MLQHPYAQLIRLDKPAGTALLLFPCWWGVLLHHDGDALPHLVMILFALGAFCMRSAGCIVNDMTDKRLDAQVSRTRSRPLASGQVSMREASILLGLLVVVAGITAAMIDWKVAVMGIAWLPLVIAYPWMKRITFFPQVFLGLTFGAGSLFGTMAVTGTITASAWWMYLASITWVIAYDTIYACQDKEDDAKVNIKSTARLFEGRILLLLLCCYVVMYGCFAVVIYLAPVERNAYTLLAGGLASGIIIRQLMQIRPDNATHCMTQFKEHVWVGAAITLLCWAA